MYLVFDIGGTNMRVAVSADGVSITNSKVVPTPENFDHGIQTIKQITEQLIERGKINGIVGGIAGALDKEKAILVNSSHITDWAHKPLKSQLENIFDCKVILENDAVLAGLGEAIKGAGINKNIVAYITIGTGVGGVRIVNNQIDKNALGFEPGHQIIIFDGDPCECGGRGHLESYVAGSYLEKKYQQKAENITNPSVWDEISKHLAVGLNNTVVHWSPDIIILGGSVSQSIPLDKVTSYLRQYLTVFPKIPEIVPATLGDDAGLYGALEYLK